MAFIKKSANGEYYVYRKYGKSVGRIKKEATIYNWFPVRSKDGGGGIRLTENVTVPKELVGKKIRLKVEVIEKW